MVAITDHMKAGYACSLSKATLGNPSFVCLPGMEVNIRPEASLSLSRLHLLAILPEGVSVERFSRLFHGNEGIGDDEHRTGQEEVRDISVKEWVKRVHEENGICVAAHVNSSQGARRLFRQAGKSVIKLLADDPSIQDRQEKELSKELREYLLDVEFDAIEVAKAADERHYRWESPADGTNKRVPVTMQLDSHCIEDLNKPERTTWIKMTSLGLDGLKNALKFPETRIRFKDELPTPPSPQLLGLQIVGDEGSLFEDESIAFAENLNCIIGPRGAGKSTIVEAIRYLFGYNRTLGELETSNKLADRIRGMQEANLTGCLIRAAYKIQTGEVRVLEATYDKNEDYSTRVLGSDGTVIDVYDIELSGEYPLRLFGWSEIETLGRDKGRQRDLLDRLIHDFTEPKSERLKIRSELKSNRQEISGITLRLEQLLETENSIITRYCEYKADFDKLNTDEVKEKFRKLDLAKLKQRFMNVVKKNIEQFLEKLRNVDIQELKSGLEQIIEESPEEINQWWHSEGIKVIDLNENSVEISKQLEVISATLGNLDELVKSQISAISREIDAVEQEIRSSFSDDTNMQKIADLRANAERRLQRASRVRNEYLNTWNSLKALMESRKAKTKELTEKQNEITGIRANNNQRIEAILNKHFGSGMKVALAQRAGGDKAAFIEAMQRTKIPQAFSARFRVNEIPEILADNFNPVSLVQKLVAGDDGAFVGLTRHDRNDKSISQDEAKKGIEKWTVTSRNEMADVTVLAKSRKEFEELLSLQEVEWDDEESILLDGRPVGELSPGQRSSAMLPLIALAETTPLVIDQPEDNLDNRLIGNVLSGILASLKEKRQIIVCTHNPNIVVSGDAEQVVVLDAVSNRKAKVDRHGSIDNGDIVQSVIEIMEGGREAFNVRQRRYGI